MLQFLARYHTFLLFLFLETISFSMVVRYNIKQKAVFDVVSSSVVGNINEWFASVNAYFHLKEENNLLQSENAGLRDVLSMKSDICKHNLYGLSARIGQFETIPAHIVRNSTQWQHNFFTIDKGSIDGVRENMAVVSSTGIAGVVFHTSSHFATVISLLNTKLQISAAIKRTHFAGTMVWDGADARYSMLVNIPNHIIIEKGDTVVTGGFSSVFPKNMAIGRVSFITSDENSNFLSLQVELFTDFSCLDAVYVLKNNYLQEQKTLEKQLPKEDG